MWHSPDDSRVMPASGVESADYTICAAPAPRRKRKTTRVPTAHVDVTLRLGPGPGTEGFNEAAIGCMAGLLGLTPVVRERAKEVFRKMEEARAWNGMPGWTKLRSIDPFYAACLNIACRNEGSPRSLKELASVTAEGGMVARKEISRLTRHIRRKLGEEAAGRATGVGVVRASSYLSRFCQLLGMEDLEAAAAKEAARRLEESDLDLEVPHIGESIAAAVVCMAIERAYADKPDVVLDVAAATGVSTFTINSVCKKLHQHAELLFG